MNDYKLRGSAVTAVRKVMKILKPLLGGKKISQLEALTILWNLGYEVVISTTPEGGAITIDTAQLRELLVQKQALKKVPKKPT